MLLTRYRILLMQSHGIFSQFCLLPTICFWFCKSRPIVSSHLFDRCLVGRSRNHESGDKLRPAGFYLKKKKFAIIKVFHEKINRTKVCWCCIRVVASVMMYNMLNWRKQRDTQSEKQTGKQQIEKNTRNKLFDMFLPKNHYVHYRAEGIALGWLTLDDV